MSTSGNGNTMLNFMQAAFGQRRRNRVEEPAEPPAPDPVALALAGWASLPECRSTFLRWLEGQIALAEAQERAHLAQHANMTYWLGRKDALRDLRSEFNNWAGQADSAPTP